MNYKALIFLVSMGGMCRLAFAAGLSMSGSGIIFPDNTTQTTAPFPPLPSKMVWVAQSDGDYTSPVAAINDLGTWCGLPSAATLLNWHSPRSI